MKTNFKRNTLALAIGLLGLGAMNNVYADAYTYASSQVTLALYDGTSGSKGDLLDASDFRYLDVLNTSQTQANLGAGTSNGTGGASSGDSTLACVGSGCGAIAENTFPTVGNGSEYARADTNLTGNIISGLGDPAPATSKATTEISLLSPNIASSTGQINNNSAFEFTLESDKKVFLDLSAIISSMTTFTSDILTGLAKSATTWQATITDDNGDIVFQWSPNATAGGITGGTELTDTVDTNLQTTCSSPGCSSSLSSIGTATALTPLLTAGVRYNFALNNTVSSQAKYTNPVPAPEPTIIGLMGIGLLGMMAVSRRRA